MNMTETRQSHTASKPNGVFSLSDINDLECRYGLTKLPEVHPLLDLCYSQNKCVDLDLVKSLINSQQCTPSELVHFANSMDIPSILWLFLQDINFDHQDRLGRTALHEAVRYNNHWLCDLLLSHQANPTLKDHQGICSIGETSYLGHSSLLERLLKSLKAGGIHRFQPHFSDNLPMALAVRNGHINCMELLVNYKVGSLNGFTPKGNSPLMIAIKNGHHETVSWLLSHGADPNLANIHGETCREITHPDRKTNSVITELLDQYA